MRSFGLVFGAWEVSHVDKVKLEHGKYFKGKNTFCVRSLQTEPFISGHRVCVMCEWLHLSWLWNQEQKINISNF
jgi:hypothetical protein